VCPVDIPLPTLIKGWRERSWREGLEPVSIRSGLRLFAFAGTRPWLYRFGTGLAARALRLMGGRRGVIAKLPGLAGAWTLHRDMPAPPAGPTFLEAEAARARKGAAR
jgi:L-lactate dehydrogenase complex protein LldF